MVIELDSAILGGGCFWCLQAVFRDLVGVASVEPGYAGGEGPAPTYEQVCGGDTGHAEVVRIRFESSLISYSDLLRIFFHMHDPTSLNRQGADVGTQYRSIIICNSEDQRLAAQSVKQEIEMARVWRDPVVTQIISGAHFSRAEEYHQDYYHRNPEQAYCQVVITPKLNKLSEKFGSKLKAG